MSADVLKSIKNGTALFDTGINKTYSQGELQALFASQIVNSGAFLDSPEQKRLYDVYDGNYTIKAKKPIDKPAFVPAKICKYENVMVYTDFPKGPSHSDTTYMWEDGTYNDMFQSVQKQNAEVPGIFPINAPLRQTVMNLAEMTGGRIEESIYKYKQGLTEEREQILRQQLAEGGINQDVIDSIIALQRAEELGAKKTSAGSFLLGKAKELYTQLNAGHLQDVVKQQRIWLSNISNTEGIETLVRNGGDREHIVRLVAQAEHNDVSAQLRLNTMMRRARPLIIGAPAPGGIPINGVLRTGRAPMNDGVIVGTAPGMRTMEQLGAVEMGRNPAMPQQGGSTAMGGAGGGGSRKAKHTAKQRQAVKITKK